MCVHSSWMQWANREFHSVEQPYQRERELISYSARVFYFSLQKQWPLVVFLISSCLHLIPNQSWQKAPDSLKLHSCIHLAFSRPLLDSGLCIENWENCYKHGWSITEWLQSENRIYRRAIKMVLLGQAVEKWLISGTGHHFFPCSCCGRPSIWNCHLPPPHVTPALLHREQDVFFTKEKTDEIKLCLPIQMILCVCVCVTVLGWARGHFWAIQWCNISLVHWCGKWFIFLFHWTVNWKMPITAEPGVTNIILKFTVS